MQRNSALIAFRHIAARLMPGAIFIVVVIYFSPAPAFAHGAVGNHIFLSPIVGNDAFPDTAVSLPVRGSDYEFSLLAAVEKEVSGSSSVLITSGWDRIEPKTRPRASGATDVSVYFRQAAYISVPHEFEVTLSPFVILPAGNRQIPDQGFTHLGGDFLVGKGLGDLPNRGSLKYLRPLAVQTEVAYAGAVQGTAHGDVLANFEVEYSLRYLNGFVDRVGLAHPWADFVPYFQFNYSQALKTSRLTTVPDFRFTPGLAYLADYWEVSVGAQVALNGAAPRGDRVGVIGLTEVYYDEIFPALGWRPF